MELLSSRGVSSEADKQRTGQGLARQPERDAWPGRVSLRERGKQDELVTVGTQIEEEQRKNQEDRGRELLDDRPCERAMNSENGNAKTMTEDF